MANGYDKIDEDEDEDIIEETINRITYEIQKSVKHWGVTHFRHIDSLLNKLEHNVISGLSNYFNTNIKIENTSLDVISVENSSLLYIEADDISNVTLKADGISAGASIALAIFISPIFAPIIGFAAMPFLQRRMLETELEKAKAKVTPELNNSIRMCIQNLKTEIEQHIAIKVDYLSASTNNKFDVLFEEFMNMLNKQIDTKEKTKNDTELIAEEIKRNFHATASKKPCNQAC